jgi:polysaccharide biosynthesis transport protein
MDTPHSPQARLSDYIRPLTARWWLVLVAVIVATGGVYAYYAHKPDVYTASTLVYYVDPGDPVNGAPTAPQTDRQVLDEATLLYSRGTAGDVGKQIGWTGTTQALLKSVAISSKEGQDFIEVTAQAGTADEAAKIANAFGSTMVSQLTNGVNYRLQQGLTLSQRELDALPNTAEALAQRATLEEQINELELAIKDPPLISRTVNAALPPTSPSAPKPGRDALFAFLLSLIGSVALAYGLERFDRRLKNPEEMERAYQRPLLSVVPHTSDPVPVRAGEASLGHEFREPFRVLRTNIELEALDAPPRTIVVSSAMPGEGKSTVVRNLALAFRETGRTVVVVDLDLRHPSMGKMFARSEEVGVTEVLRHEKPIEDAVIAVGVGMDPLAEFLLSEAEAANGNGSNGSSATKTNGDGKSNGRSGRNGNGNGNRPHAEVGVLLAGTRPANPAVVLASERVTEVLDDLKERYDIVLIDSAPVLAVSDTIPLLRYADAALFVGRLDVTTRDTAKRLMEFLDRVPGLNLLGIVANDLSRMDAGGYGYGYGYGPYGTTGNEPPPASRTRLPSPRRSRRKQPV